MKNKIIRYGAYVLTAVLVSLVVLLIINLIEKKKINDMVNSFYDAYESKERTIVLYASSECWFCKLEKPILKQISKDYNLKYVNLDISKLNEKQLTDIKKKLNIEGLTPTTVVLEDGKIINTQVGYLDGQDYVDFFIESGMIKEGSKYLPENKIKFIGYDELINMKDGIVVLGQTADQKCTDLKATMNKISKKYNVEINYFNFRSLNEIEFYRAHDYVDEINDTNYKIHVEDKISLPLIVVIKNGKIVKVIDSTKEDKIVANLKLK